MKTGGLMMGGSDKEKDYFFPPVLFVCLFVFCLFYRCFCLCRKPNWFGVELSE